MYDARILMASAIFAFHMASCHARSVQSLWVNPVAPDFTTEVMNGALFNVSWDSSLWQVFSEFAPTADVDNVDLWCMGYYSHQLGQLVSTQVSVKTTSNLLWKVTLPENYLEQTSAWVFRFLPHGTSIYGAQLSNDSVSSPGLQIAPTLLAPSTTTPRTTLTQLSTKTATAAPSSSVAATNSTSIMATSTEVALTIAATQTSSSAAATTALSVTPVPTASPSPSHTGLSTGAKVNIGVGAGMGAAAVLAIAFCAVLKTRRRRAKDSDRSCVHPSQRLHGHAIHEMNGETVLTEFKRQSEASSSAHLSRFPELKSGARSQAQPAPVELP